jgi:lysine 2,3-aminomutase
MAGQTGGVFREKLSAFLRAQYATAAQDPVRGADVLRTLRLQYFVDEREQAVLRDQRRRHFESGVDLVFEGRALRGVERLYRRTLLLMPTLACAAHCRWCVRGQYPIATLSLEDIDLAARYCGEAPEADGVEEVLVSGGDALMDVARLERVFGAFERFAPRVKVVRLATRVPLQDPDRVDARLLDLLHARRGRVEIGLHVNHTAELVPAVCDAIARIAETGARIYNQTVLLRHLNDEAPVLETLFEALRQHEIEMHYLFHCVPIYGMAHHRTSLDRALDLVRRVSSGGRISGRAKPSLTLLTDVGKVTLYEGSILTRRDGQVLVQTGYDYEERRAFNPSWTLPPSASIDADGLMRVWYADAVESVRPQELVASQST